MAAPKKADAESLYVAKESFVDADGLSYHKDITRISGDVVAKNKWEHLFKAIEATRMGVEQATAAPGEKRGAE